MRIVFSGAPDNPEYGQELMVLARELGVEHRVEWKGFVGEDEMIRLYAGARGVVFTPIDEDLGYIALEAMLAGKPLLTLSDTGEPAALTRDGIEGFVTAPVPAALAEAMNRLASSRELAGQMGEAALQRYKSLDISWTHVVAKLTESKAPTSCASIPDPSSREFSTSQELSMRRELSMRMDHPDGATAPSINEKAVVERAETGTPAGAATDDISFDELGRRYEIDALGHESYYETHWPRYRASLRVIAASGLRPTRILELGTSKPYAFTALLREAYPEARFCVVQETPVGVAWSDKIKGRRAGVADVDLSVHGLNLETDRLPFDDGDFDLVVAMEILEHFAIDPGFVFREVNRVLRVGGAFMATTPNLVSLQAIGRALHGGSPYSFGVYVPTNGVYGRHNREFTPREVESLGRYAGFETLLVHTEDIYPQDGPPASLVDYMSRESFPLNARGQNIFYLGRKSLHATRDPFPDNLFAIDPAIFSGAIELHPAPGDADAMIIRARNESPLVWRAEGRDRVRLSVDRVDQNGRVDLDALRFDFPRDIAPGGVGEIALKSIKGDGARGCWWEIGLFIDGVGPFKGAGRARTPRLFTETLERAPLIGRDDDAT